MSELVDHVLELLEPFGDVSARRMFGGHGLFHQGVMFALEADDVLYFKVDDKTRPEFDKRELTPFEYARNGNSVTLSYRMAPEEAMNSSKRMCKWAKDAYNAAVRTSESARAEAEAEKAAAAATALETPNKALSDTAKLQTVALPNQANGAKGQNGTVNPMLAAQASPAEVAAKLAEQRRAKEAKNGDATAEPAKIVSAVKALNGSAKLGKNGELAKNSEAGKAAANKPAEPKSRKQTTKSNGKSAAKTAAKTTTKSAARATSGRKRANGNGASAKATRTASGTKGSDDGPLRKTINRRAAAILTRSMLGSSAAH